MNDTTVRFSGKWKKRLVFLGKKLHVIVTQYAENQPLNLDMFPTFHRVISFKWFGFFFPTVYIPVDNVLRAL